jgi:ABC-2 type transport system permease protein
MRRWLRSYILLLRWQFGRLRALLPLLIIVQILLASGLVIGLGFLLPSASTPLVAYLATGAPTVVLVSVGFVIVPQQVSQSKSEGSIEFFWSLPVPRLAYLIADLTLWLGVSLPGMLLSLSLAAIHYNVPFSISYTVVPVSLLVALTATCVGYAIAIILPALAAQLVSQVLVFVILMFAPINFPTSRLPAWARAVHDVLPFRAMGDVMRHALMPTHFQAHPWQYLVVLIYCGIGLLGTTWALQRRS